MDLQAIMIANGSTVLLMLIVLYSMAKSIKSRMPDSVMFYIMVMFTILQAVMETLSFVFDGNTMPFMDVVLKVINIILFIGNISFAFIWSVYCDYKVFSDLKRIKKIYKYIMIPALLVSLFAIVNFFTPIFFTINADNTYERTNFIVLPYIITYAYLIYGVVIIYKNRKKGKKYLFMPALIFMIPIFIGSVIQFLFYGVSTIWVCTAIALTSVYINVQNEVTYIDSLSGLYNRQYMNGYLEIEAKKKSSNGSVFAGIMLDIDNFKSINDSFGHSVGDDAIRSAGEILRDCNPENTKVIRYAGDEFVILGEFKSKSAIESMLDKIGEKTRLFIEKEDKPYQIVFSAGFAVFDSQNDSIDRFLTRMDAEMYEQKTQKKVIKVI